MGPGRVRRLAAPRESPNGGFPFDQCFDAAARHRDAIESATVATAGRSVDHILTIALLFLATSLSDAVRAGDSR